MDLEEMAEDGFDDESLEDVDPSEFIDEFDDAIDPEQGVSLTSPQDVTLTSGSHYEVMNAHEAAIVANLVSRYTSEYSFSSISDLQDVDRIIIMELTVYRYGSWQNRGTDYHGDEIDSDQLGTAILNASKEVRQIKKALGIDRVSRDKAKGESVADYLEDLRVRARQFGINRENQLDVALELFQELSGMVTLYWNCDEEERRDEHITSDRIMEWLRDTAIPKFEAVDRHFQVHEQKFWIRDV